ncbi:hypothetical protein [Gordonia tangerina]|uniref:Uncharacterized protein n=1 Tax=Gordonia tangerina TaxID=2911060 RepID=A0ABS9DNW2_9ACTN|nr:hypothetical protein [Gordonia tangerina]MCF3939959.1 hypothetical protein [Gordonia tangerina]
MTDIRDNATAFIASAEPCSPGCLHDHCELSQAVVLVQGMLAELDRAYAEIDRTGSGRLARQLEAFGRDCVANGDMTPAAGRMLRRIMGGAE